jgi:uncharacterized protein YjiS (DUF1127 family)
MSHTFITASAPAKAAQISSLEQLTRKLASLWARLVLRRAQRATRAALHSLDDRMLHDIGVTRGKIDLMFRDPAGPNSRWPH